MRTDLTAEGNPTLSLFTAEKTIQTAMINTIFTALGSLYINQTYGSAHHGVTKVTDDALRLIEAYIRAALQWLLDLGRATSITVSASKEDKHRIKVDLSAVQADGLEISFSVYYHVG